MRANYQHCESVVREGDRDRYIASLFAPADRRPHLHALYAFDRELSLVPHRVHEALAGEMRLQWWRDALAGEARGDAAAHPVAAALLDTVARCGLPVEPLDALIDARALRALRGAVRDHRRLRRLRTADRIRGAGARLAEFSILRRRSARRPPPPASRRHSPACCSHSRRMRRAGGSSCRSTCSRARGAREELGAGRPPAQLRAAVQEIADRAREQLAEARRARDAVTPARGPHFFRSPPSRALLERLARDPDPFRPAGLAPWRRQWLMWRAARRGVF